LTADKECTGPWACRWSVNSAVRWSHTLSLGKSHTTVLRVKSSRASTINGKYVYIRSTQPCIPPELLNHWVPALIGCCRGGNVTSAGWQITLCDPIWDPIWHVSSCSGEANCVTAICVYLYLLCTLVASGPLLPMMASVTALFYHLLCM